jgi:two-component system, LytTR family, response regulator
MMVKVLLVDDEELARQGMRSLLATCEDVIVVGECENGEDALDLIVTLEPQLVFVDIQMPKRNGMSLVQQLGSRSLPLIVFVTAHEDYAVDAFDTVAVDYLLKPVRPARLFRTMERVREQLDKLARAAETSAPLPEPESIIRRKKLLAKTKDKITPIDVEAITTIEAAGNYAVVHTAHDRFILRETLTTLEKELPTDQFARVNRSMIVNLNQVVELQVAGLGSNQVLLKDGRTAPLTLPLREMEKLLQFTGR